jgi:hypothetical protein
VSVALRTTRDSITRVTPLKQNSEAALALEQAIYGDLFSKSRTRTTTRP